MFRTREAWLKAFTAAVLPHMKAKADLDVPPDTLVSCGWPSDGGRKRKNRSIGECWTVTPDRKRPHVFVSPVLEDRMEVAQVLVHELIHAALPADVGHRGAFVTAKNNLELGGKPTATKRTPEFDAWVKPIVEELGKYPHEKLDPAPKKKKQGTRMKKYLCPGCGFIARASRKWLNMYDSNPTCPCGEEWEQA